MKKFIWKKRFSLPETIGLICITVISVAVISYAASVPNTFEADTVISAGEVNANFAALVSAVTALETQVATIQANKALLLDPYLTISSATINGLSGPHVILHDANLHIQNGSGATTNINGVGNLLVGYNEEPPVLNPGDRGGSHNLIVGPEHKYLSLGGFLAGFRNTVTTRYSSVSGGESNTASNYGTNVSGGYQNTASGITSSVCGGHLNEASGNNASVSGGYNNIASGDSSSVSGGRQNEASGNDASISGGRFNTAIGSSSSVSGGWDNEASGWYSSVSGGDSNIASGWYSSVSGGQYNTASGGRSSVSGGWSNTASGLYSNVSGGQSRSAIGQYDWVAGSLWEDL